MPEARGYIFWHPADCMHLVYKGIGTSCSMTRGLWPVWIAPPQNKGMSDTLRAPQIFFSLPESCVNLPGLERLQNTNQHLPPLGSSETNEKTSVLFPITIKQHWHQRNDSSWNRPLPNTFCDQKHTWKANALTLEIVAQMAHRSHCPQGASPPIPCQCLSN